MIISRFEIAVVLIRKKFPPTARSASISGEKGVKRDDALWRELRPSVSGFGEGNPDKGDSWSFIVRQHNELKCLLDQFPEATFSSELSDGTNPKANKNNSVERFLIPSHPIEKSRKEGARRREKGKKTYQKLTSNILCIQWNFLPNQALESLTRVIYDWLDMNNSIITNQWLIIYWSLTLEWNDGQFQGY